MLKRDITERVVMPTENKGFSLQLVEVICESFSKKEKLQAMEVVPEKLQVAHRVVIEVLLDGSAINVITSLKYLLEDRDVSEISVRCRFKAEPFWDLVKIDKETHTVDFEEALVFTIVPVAFSTTRGYYLARLEGTPLASYPYPIIQTEDLLRQIKISLPAETVEIDSI